MITIFNAKQFNLALNLLCSSQVTKIPKLFHLLIVTDKISYKKMRQFKKELILFDVEDRKYTYENYGKIKLFIIYYLVSIGVETTICDIVFFKNPMKLFEETSIIEWSTEGTTVSFDCAQPHFDYHQWNVAFMRIKPCLASILILQKWILNFFHFLVANHTLHILLYKY